MPSSTPLLVIPIVLGLGGQSAPPTTEKEPRQLDLAIAMSDPAWIGAFPQRPRWTADGRLLFTRRVGDTDEEQIFEVDPSTGEERLLPLEEGISIVYDGRWNRDHSLMTTTRGGDIMIVDRDGSAIQLTRTSGWESPPRWLTDGRIVFERDGSTIIRDLDTGIETEPASIRFGDPPKPPEAPEGLAADQRRLFATLRENADRREANRLRGEEAREANSHDVTGPIYLPPDERESGRHLSPDARWMLLEVAPKNRPDARRDDMAIWVTDDGYVTQRALRPKVGTQARTSERLVLVDLETGEAHDLPFHDLPDRRTDRMTSIREENRVWLEAMEAGTGQDPDPSIDDPTSRSTDTEDTALAIVTALAESAAQPTEEAAAEPKPLEPRPCSISRVSWSPDGSMAAAMIRSLDNKDRWIVAIDPRAVVDTSGDEDTTEEGSEAAEPGTETDPDVTGPRTPAPEAAPANQPPITIVEHLFDPGWINWSFNEMDWTRNGSTLWFLSEASGWSDLLAWSPGSEARPLASGRFEIRDVQEHPIDDTLFFRSNRDDPSTWRLERLDPESGWSETIAGGQGMIERFTLAPDGSMAAFTESFLDRPAELFVVDLPPAGGKMATPRRLTDSASETFTNLDWEPARLVDVPGRHGRAIRGRLHLPPPEAPALADGRRPAVLFVHGAGYLQNAHAGWSRYFREGFFHDLLARHGYVVLDLDYRASSGYGRDWRTAIARDMGPSELDDYEDGIAWLAEHHDVDPDRIGMYGGSYGGFTTLMGLFTRPGTFKAGAALRPVTDWSFYNDGYTANILNTPQDDPLAYRRSSPIEHAEGLEDALLICHGMVDSNVPYSDTVRLAQRLIELGKVDWEVAAYPVEGHGFKETSSWIDEYRRIHELFDRTLWVE